jgi:hypothetical protein
MTEEEAADNVEWRRKQRARQRRALVRRLTILHRWERLDKQRMEQRKQET